MNRTAWMENKKSRVKKTWQRNRTRWYNENPGLDEKKAFILPVKPEVVTMYWGGARRWTTKRAEAEAEAKRLIMDQCECGNGYHRGEESGCRYHGTEQLQYWKKLVKRMGNFVLRKWNEQD